MTRLSLLVGTIGVGLLGSIFGAGAQEADPRAAGAVAPQAPECSGLGCIFGWREAPRPEAAQAVPARGDAVRAGAATQPTVERKAAKPIHQVTIAAAPAEVAKLKHLASVLPKQKIKIVAARGEKDRVASDFSVSTDLAPSKDEKAKLFTEQMHVVARDAVQSISDLEGKVVSFGPDKSSSQAVARKAFEALNVRVEETPLDVDNALDGLSTGDVDAVVILAPQPIERLKSVSTPGIHLVSWPENGALPSGAVASAIDANAYPSLAKPGEKIRAMGVDATLNISQKGAKETTSKGFLKALSEHSDALTKRGFDLLKADLDSRSGRFLASVAKP